MPYREVPQQIFPHDSEYPADLKTIKEPPKSLWIRGAGMSTDLFHLASIGPREKVEAETLQKITAFVEGVCIAYRDTAQLPLVITSGLALGVDAASHRAGLSEGHTVAVLPSPINRMYPPENIELARKMLEVRQPGTAIVSEYAPLPDGINQPKQPLARNRITVGMSQALLVSGLWKEYGGGSLATANHALKEKRPVFFIEGTVTANVRRLLLGVYKAEEVSDPRALAEKLITLNQG